jgi:regulatory protein
MSRGELPEKEQAQIIQYLQREKFLDEKRFCKAFVNDKSKYNRWGSHKIKYELKKKQIPDTLIREALSGMNTKETREQLRQLLETKRKTVKGANAYEINQKLMRFAAGRGFAIEDIQAALDFNP